MGQPGSKKSTLCRKLLDNLPVPFEWVSSDNFVERLGWGDYDTNYPHVIKEASKRAKQDRNRFVCNNQDFIWDQTNLNFTYQFPKHYYRIAVVMPLITWEETQRVNTLRIGKQISQETYWQFKILRIKLDVPKLSMQFNEIIEVEPF